MKVQPINFKFALSLFLVGMATIPGCTADPLLLGPSSTQATPGTAAASASMAASPSPVSTSSVLSNGPISATMRTLGGDPYFAVADGWTPGSNVYFTNNGTFTWRQVGYVTGAPSYFLCTAQGFFVLRAQDLTFDASTGQFKVTAYSPSDSAYPAGMFMSKSAPGARDGMFSDSAQTIPGRIFGLLGESALQGNLSNVTDLQLQQYYGVAFDHNSDIAIAMIPGAAKLTPSSYGVDIKSAPPLIAAGTMVDSLRAWFRHEGSNGPQLRPDVGNVLTHVDLQLAARSSWQPALETEMPLLGKGFMVFSRKPSPTKLSELLFAQTASLSLEFDPTSSLLGFSDLAKLGPSSMVGIMRLVNQDGLYVLGSTRTSQVSDVSNALLPLGGDLGAMTAAPEAGGVGLKALQVPFIKDSNVNFDLNVPVLGAIVIGSNGLLMRDPMSLPNMQPSNPMLPNSTSEFENQGQLSLGAVPAAGDQGLNKGDFNNRLLESDKYLTLMTFANPNGLVKNADGTYAWAPAAGTASISLPGN